jgi:hypothetical protein
MIWHTLAVLSDIIRLKLLFLTSEAILPVYIDSFKESLTFVEKGLEKQEMVFCTKKVLFLCNCGRRKY